MSTSHEYKKKTIGSLFAGIGGFDLGFERAGWQTAWTAEINPLNRAVLGHRFPSARHFEDVRCVGKEELGHVDCITAGFPCQDISQSGSSAGGKRPGLRGARSGLFYQVIRILRELRPEWVVLENVAALLSCNDCEDIQAVIQELADCGYMGCFRVLDAAHFGSPARRRRVFLVGRLGGPAPLGLLDDAAPVDAIPSAFGSGRMHGAASSWPGYTLQASNSAARVSLGSELLVAQEDGWNQMVERQRKAADHGIPLGLDSRDWHDVYASGNSVAVQVSQWIAEKINAEMKRGIHPCAAH